MKNSILFLFFLQLFLLVACEKPEVTTIDNESNVVSKVSEGTQANVRKANTKNLLSKYAFQATFEGKPSREFELVFTYNEKGILENIKRTNRTYNQKTGLVLCEGFTNWSLKYNNEGLLIQTYSYTDKSLTFNVHSIMSYAYENSKLSTVNQALIKDEKQILSLERYKLTYNPNKQLMSYKSGNDKGHDFNYTGDTHTSSLLKGVSSYDFEYGSGFNPTADYEDGLKFVIFQAMEADAAMGFGLVSQNLPSSLINRSGGSSEFETTLNEEQFPTKIVEKRFNRGNIYSNHTYTTKIEYVK